jgi:hypothetical protein
MDIGKLYDQSIAGTYDQDQWGLLSGGRNTAFRQIQAHVAKRRVNDAGTGESLLKIKELFPEAKLHGIDLSSEMLDIAKTKLSFNAIHDARPPLYGRHRGAVMVLGAGRGVFIQCNGERFCQAMNSWRLQFC